MPILPGHPNTAPLEPFDPPPGYRFEPELQETPPRHVPEEFRSAPYFARQRSTMVGFENHRPAMP